jgi:hypothetical protein
MIEELLNKIIFKYRLSDDRIDFYCNDGHIYSMYHEQDCCESVYIDDISGDLNDIIGSPILMADESCSSNTNLDGSPLEDEYESCTWTFYRFATVKGYVNIRWFGASNGYYSESVNISMTNEPYSDDWKYECRDYKLEEILRNE